MGRFISVVFYIDRKVYYFLRFHACFTQAIMKTKIKKTKGVIYMKKLALGVLAGWVIRGAYELVWMHRSSYSDVYLFKAELDGEIEQCKEAASEISEAVFN